MKLPMRRPSGRRGLTSRRTVYAVLAFLLVVGLLSDLPGRVCRGRAASALSQNRPHVALAWVTRSRSLSAWKPWANQEGDAATEALAYLRLNSASRATKTLDGIATPSTPFARTRAALQTLADCQRGDLTLVPRLTADFVDQLPPPAIFEAIVRCAQFNGRFEMARSVVDDWQRQFPADAAAAYQRGRNAELTERFDESITAYREALRLQSDLCQAAFREGVVLAARRDFEGSVDALRRCNDTPCAAIAAIERANSLWELQRIDEAWQTLAPLIDLSPSSLVDPYLQADHYVEEDRIAVVGSRIAESRGDDPQAIRLLQRALEYNPRNFEAVGRLAAILRRSGQVEDADAKSKDHQRMLGQRERAVELRGRLVDHPEDVEARLELAKIYFEVESLADTQLEIDAILRDQPDHEAAKRLLREVARQWSRMRGEGLPGTADEVVTAP